MKFALISTFGSVIAKQDLIFPSKSGCSHLSCGKIIIKAGKVQLKSELKSINITVWLFSSRNNMKRYNFFPSEVFGYHTFCSSVPYLISTSMLPVSGAEQLNSYRG